MHSIRTSQKTQRVSFRKTNWRVLYRKAMIVYCEHTKNN